jgi:hypothetical protein
MEPERPGNPGRTERSARVRRRKISLAEFMALIAGLAVGMWLIVPDFREARTNLDSVGYVLLGTSAILGGLSLAGLPLLLREAWVNRGGPRWEAGRVLWFAAGDSAWLLWPPIVVRRIQGSSFGQTNTGVCFAYGTPLMALYVTLALAAGGWFGRRNRRRLAQSWRERFGLVLGLAWACTGLYVLSLIYREDLTR